MNKRLFLLVLGVALLAPGCADLVENPQDQLAPDGFFTTARDARAAMDGAYSLLAEERTFGRKFYLIPELLSDDADIGDLGTAARRVEMNEFRADPNNGLITVAWPNLYEAISAANIVVDRVPEVEDMSPEAQDAIVAEGKFLRSLIYFHLVRLFGDVPYLTAFVEDPASVIDISRTPADEVYAGIIQDLNEAIPALPPAEFGGVKSRATQGAAQMLLAKVHLTRENWCEAADLAEQVIGGGTFRLVDDFADLFNADNGDTDEHIFTVDFLAGITGTGGGSQDDMWAALSGVRQADVGAGWGVNVPTLKFYDSFNDADYRKEVSFLDSTIVDGELVPATEFPSPSPPRPHIGKWAREPGDGADEVSGRVSGHNIPLFRYAETLLVAAEAINECGGGPTPEAVGYVNEVRARARGGGRLGPPSDFPPDLESGLSQMAFREAVWEERRLELAFEIKRWYDLVRTNRVLEALGNAETSLEYHPEVTDFVNTHNTLLPIPGDEIDRNPNLSQNPGY